MTMQETLIIVVIGQAGIVVGKIVFDWLRERRNGSNGTAENVRWLRKIHEKTDEDGTPIWYFPRSIEKKLDKMIEHLAQIKESLK